MNPLSKEAVLWTSCSSSLPMRHTTRVDTKTQRQAPSLNCTADTQYNVHDPTPSSSSHTSNIGNIVSARRTNPSIQRQASPFVLTILYTSTHLHKTTVPCQPSPPPPPPAPAPHHSPRSADPVASSRTPANRPHSPLWRAAPGPCTCGAWRARYRAARLGCRSGRGWARRRLLLRF